MSDGLPIVISAPSGGGKSTIAARLLSQNPNLSRSISCTTRKPRNGEQHGVDYFFLTETDFKAKVQAGAFLEWATVHENLYGTPKDAVDQSLKNGKDVILTIDPQGAVALRKLYPQGIYIFLVPPAWETLERRLTARASDDQSSLKVRLAGARTELQSLPYYDYLVINDELDSAVSVVASIICAEHHRLTRIDKKDIPFLHGVST